MGRSREQRKATRPESARPRGNLDIIKPLARFLSLRPPSAISGGVSALSGSSSSGPSLPERAVTPLPTPPGSLWAWAVLHVGTCSSTTRPHFHLVCCRPTPPIPTLPRYSQFPATPEHPQLRRATRRAVRGARGWVSRGAVTRRTGARLPPGASPLADPWRAGRLPPGLRAPGGCNGLELGASGSRRREHAPVRWLAGAHAPERAPGRGEQREPRRGRCGSAGTPAPSRGCDPQPAARPKPGKGRWGRGGVRLWESWGRSEAATAAALEEEKEAEELLSSSQTSERPGRRARNWGGRGVCGVPG